MLERLGLKYIDLLLLHQQVGDYIAAYKAMEKAVEMILQGEIKDSKTQTAVMKTYLLMQKGVLSL